MSKDELFQQKLKESIYRAEKEIDYVGDLLADNETYLNKIYMQQASVGSRRNIQAGTATLEELLVFYSNRGDDSSAVDEHLDSLVTQVIASANIDTRAPTDSQIPAGTMGKGLLAKLMSWYVGYVGNQLNDFTATTARSIEYLASNRQSNSCCRGQIQDRIDIDVPFPLLGKTSWPRIFDDPLHERMSSQHFQDVRYLCGDGGRILHIGLQDRESISKLHGFCPNSYGVVGSLDSFSQSEIDLWDLRVDSFLGHLSSVGNAALVGLIVENCVEIFGPIEIATFIGNIDRIIGENGFCIISSISSQAWREKVQSPVKDLSSSVPIHPETWVYLFNKIGFSAQIMSGTDDSQDQFSVVATRILSNYRFSKDGTEQA